MAVSVCKIFSRRTIQPSTQHSTVLQEEQGDMTDTATLPPPAGLDVNIAPHLGTSLEAGKSTPVPTTQQPAVRRTRLFRTNKKTPASQEATKSQAAPATEKQEDSSSDTEARRADNSASPTSDNNTDDTGNDKEKATPDTNAAVASIAADTAPDVTVGAGADAGTNANQNPSNPRSRQQKPNIKAKPVSTADNKKPGFFKRIRAMLTPKSSRHENANVDTNAPGEEEKATDVTHRETPSQLATTDNIETRPHSSLGKPTDDDTYEDAVGGKQPQSTVSSTGAEQSVTKRAEKTESSVRAKSPRATSSRSNSPHAKHTDSTVARPQSPLATHSETASQAPPIQSESKTTDAAIPLHTPTSTDPNETKITSRPSSSKSMSKSPKEPKDGGLLHPKSSQLKQAAAGNLDNAGHTSPALSDADDHYHDDDSKEPNSPQHQSPTPQEEQASDGEFPEPPKDVHNAKSTVRKEKKEKLIVVVKPPDSDADDNQEPALTNVAPVAAVLG